MAIYDKAQQDAQAAYLGGALPGVVTGVLDGRTYTALIGDGTATDIVVTHGLGVLRPAIRMWRDATGFEVIADYTSVDSNSVNIGFANPPAVGEFRVQITHS